MYPDDNSAPTPQPIHPAQELTTPSISEPNTPGPMPTPFAPTPISPAYPAQPVSTPAPAQQPYAAEPAFQSAVPVAPAPTPHVTSPGLVILQWLTYAFWGWTILALSALTSMVIANFIAKTDVSSTTPYAIAAVLVLLPIAFVCDIFYSRKEEPKKSGGSMAVMVIHAVIFALLGIGSLIFAVFSVVQLMTDSSDHTSIHVALFSSLIIAIYYGATFLRTLDPANLKFIQKFYRLFMLGTVSIIIILSIVGPLAFQRRTRNDKLIVSNLDEVSRSIGDYARGKNKLPASLSDLSFSGDTKKLIENNLVEYKPEGSTKSNDYYTRYATYRYQLCVTYAEKSSSYSSYDSSSTKDEYASYLSVYDHPKGYKCYKLQTTDY